MKRAVIRALRWLLAPVWAIVFACVAIGDGVVAGLDEARRVARRSWHALWPPEYDDEDAA